MIDNCRSFVVEIYTKIYDNYFEILPANRSHLALL